MPKNKKMTPVKSKKIDFEKKVMSKVVLGQIVMKPRWYFVVGSLLMVAGLVGLSMGAVFLTNITLFLLRRRGPMRQWRLEMMLGSFPWWVPALAVLSVILGVWILKKYDFFYKKNFLLIIVGFVVAIVISAWLIDYLGLNEIWSRRGPMRRFYQRFEPRNDFKKSGRRFN